MNNSLAVFTLPGKVRRQRETSFFPLSRSMYRVLEEVCEFKIDGGVAAVAVVESIPTLLNASNEVYLGGPLPRVSQAPSDRRVTKVRYFKPV